MHEVTIFKSINSHIPQYFEVEEVLARIKKGINKKLINNIRVEKNEEKRNTLKKGLLWICFSGKFNKRLNSELVLHSGLICLDFDKFPNIQTLNKWMAMLKNDKHCYSAFISPSGNGIKALYKIPKCKDNNEHNARFEAISNSWNKCKYFDNNVKGSNRVCFESYDPNLYLNKNAIEFTAINKKETIVIPEERLVHLLQDTNTIGIFEKLIIWFESKYNLQKGNRNTNLFYLLSACRDYNIPENISTFQVINYAMKNADDFDSIHADIPKIAHQAYLKPSANKTMMLMPTTDIANEQDDSIVIENILYEEVEIEIKEKTKGKLPTEYIFWKWGVSSYKIDFLLLKKFLQEQGFYRYEINEKDFIFVRVIENTVQELDVRHIKDFMLRCLEEWDKPDIYNMVAENTKIKKEYLNYLDPIEIAWNKDTKEYGWVYFNNVAVRVSKNKIELINYINLDGFIWKTQKLNRDFNLKTFEESKESDFANFIKNICNSDKKRINSFHSAIGYMIHGFKNKSTVKAVILNDEIVAEDAMGGTGKGLTMQVIGSIKNVIIIPGADFNTGKDFAWQRINFDTDIVLIDDIEKNFKYKKLFTFLTDGWPISKKYQDEIFMTPEDSPKIVINTNYIIKGDTDSYARRKFELELYPAYSKKYQPIDDFKKEFITEWDKEEHNLCDNFLLHCLKFFLNKGLIEPEYVNLKFKKIILNTSEDFYAYAKDFLLDNTKYNKKDIFIIYKKEHGLSIADYPNQKAFTKWMEFWGEYKGYRCRNRFGAGGKYFVYGTGEHEWKDQSNSDLVF